MKVIFMGTSPFAVPPLEAISKEHEIAAVITMPDRPKGRGKKLAVSSVKEAALKLNLNVLQPENVNDESFLKKLSELSPDVSVVAAYGQILKEKILEMPRYGCINIHGSLLPKLRGAAPIQHSIINGDKKTGVTTMYMDKGLDTGDMILKAETDILEEYTYGELHDKLSFLGAELILKTLALVEDGTAPRSRQEHEAHTYAPPIKREDEHILWDKNSSDIFNLVRALDPLPGAYTIYKDEELKIWKTEKSQERYDGIPGEITSLCKRYFTVKTSDGAVNILEVQAKGGKRMNSGDYMRGHMIEKGNILK